MNHGCHTSRALGTPTCNSEVAELVWYNTRTVVYALWKKIAANVDKGRTGWKTGRSGLATQYRTCLTPHKTTLNGMPSQLLHLVLITTRKAAHGQVILSHDQLV